MATDAHPSSRRRTVRRRRRAVASVGLAVALATCAAATGPPSGAQTASSDTPPSSDPVGAADAEVARLRSDADALADRYFTALANLVDLQQRVDEIERRLPALAAEADRLRTLTRERAAIAYKRSGRDLGQVIAAGTALRAARRAQWLDRLNQRDGVLAADLRTASARLADERVQLHGARDDAVAALDRVKDQGRAIDALLVDAVQRRATAVTATVATEPAVPAVPGNPAVRVVPGNPAGSPAAPAATAPPATAAPATPTAPPTPTTTTTLPKTTPPDSPPSYAPTPGVHPRHDEPFLVCTRARESGGNYAAYNPAGPYMGAYQFLQATWNSVANHLGRTALIGVPPSTASQYDQDDVAWALYQWQGSRPWGGFCDG